MLYVINQKGKTEVFRAAKISQTINKLYLSVMGAEKAYLYRKDILIFTQKVMKRLPADGEVKREFLATSLEEVLRDAPLAIHENFLEAIEQKQKKKKYTINQDFVDNIDPVLTRTHIKNPLEPSTHNSISNPLLTKEYPLSIWIKTLKGFMQDYGPFFPAFKDEEKLDWEWLKKLSWRVGRGDDQYWVAFWIKTLSSMWVKQKEAYYLASFLNVRYEVSKAMGSSLFDGTELSLIDEQISPYFTELLYKTKFVEYAKTLSFNKNINFEKIKDYLKPDRDYMINLKGYEVLKFSLQKLDVGYEPPQWMWMRVAMFLGKDEEEMIRIYELISLLKFIPAEGILREAGKSSPDYFEDSAVRVQDNLESIYNAIKETLVSTKWTGNISVDWGKVRGKDAAIAGGLRKSGGVVAYWKMINHALESQGRLDFPATMVLPVWHMDILHYLNNIADFPYIKVAIKIPDYFMNIFRKTGYLYLFDPSDSEKLNSATTPEEFEAEYQNIITNLPERNIKISSNKLWEKMIDGISTGRLRIIFSDNVEAHLFDKNFEDHKNSSSEEHKEQTVFSSLSERNDMKNNWLAGIDGVGILPNSNLTWPTGVINLRGFIDKDNILNIRELQSSLETVLRIYKKLTKNDVLCLGVVGFWEYLEGVADWEKRSTTGCGTA